MSKDYQPTEPFNFKPLWRALIPIGLIGFFTLVPGPGFRISSLDELVRQNDGKSGLSLPDVRTLSEYSGINSTKLETDYHEDGKLTYDQYDQAKLRTAWNKYQQNK